KRLARLIGIVALVGLGLSFVAPGIASAHERRIVGGDYTFVVGFLKEPAFEGETNGIDLRVSKAGDQPAEGVEQPLKAEVMAGRAATARTRATTGPLAALAGPAPAAWARSSRHAPASPAGRAGPSPRRSAPVPSQARLSGGGGTPPTPPRFCLRAPGGRPRSP